MEIKLTPHTITYRTTDTQIIRTHALKVVTVENDADKFLNGLIECLTRTPKDSQYSTTVDFKLIPFQSNVIGRDGITELITQHNNLLHSTMAASVIDGGGLLANI